MDAVLALVSLERMSLEHDNATETDEHTEQPERFSSMSRSLELSDLGSWLGLEIA